MKKFILLLLAIVLTGSIYTQSCLEDGLVITTQEQIDNFSADYDGCTDILGNLEIIGTGSNIENLEGLAQLQTIQESFILKFCSSLTSIEGIQNIQSVGGDFLTQSLHNLLDLNLSNLEYVGGSLEIFNFSNLESFNLENLISVNEDLVINGVSNLEEANLISLNYVGSLMKFEGTKLEYLNFPELINLPSTFRVLNNSLLTGINVPNVSSSGGIQLELNPLLEEVIGLDQITDFGGSIMIMDNAALYDFNFLSSVTTIDGGLYLEHLPLLSSLETFSNLESINLDLRISNNNLLVNLNGLENLESVNQQLIINQNANLISLDGIQNINELNGTLCLMQNPNLVDISSINIPNGNVNLELINNQSLFNLDGLENIANLVGWIQIDSNPLIENLNFLDNADINDLTQIDIYGNSNLSVCNHPIICEFLEESPDNINLENNAPGCISNSEVAASCGIVGIEEFIPNANSVYPNPTEGIINVSSSSPVRALELFNIYGQLISIKTGSNYVDLTDVSSGFYVLKITDVNGNSSKLKVQKN